MKRRRLIAGALGLALAVAACQEDRSERIAASYSSVTKASERPLPKPQPQKPSVGLAAIPAEEDYEVRAASSITDANLLEKLAELERELRPQ